MEFCYTTLAVKEEVAVKKRYAKMVSAKKEA